MRGGKLDRNVISGFPYFRGKSQIQLRREMKKSIWKQSSKVLEVLQQILLVTEVSVWKHEHGVRQSQSVGFIYGQYQLRTSQGYI